MRRRDPVEALLRAIRGYARAKGEGVLAILEAGGQERVKIRVSALYRFHDPETGFQLLEDAVSSLTEGDLERLESMGVRLVRLGRVLYVEVPRRLLEEARGERV